MKDTDIMKLDGVVDPYNEIQLPKGRKVRCYKTVNGVTMCRVEKESFLVLALLTILGMIILAILFSIKITIIPT